MMPKISIALSVLLLGYGAGAASTFYVSTNSPNPAPPYATWDTAAHSIQPAVDAASDGDTVLVSAGEYLLTSQVTIAKAILLRSAMGSGQTTLNGNSRDRCLWVSNTLAVVDGFTMFRGEGPDGAGIFLVGGTVQNCSIANCYPTRSLPGASVTMIGGVLSNSVVRYAFVESRLVHCSNGGLITDCQITDGRMGTADGTGVYLVNSQLRNSIVARMTYQYGAGEHGAGVYAVSSTISGCTITGNRAGRAGGGAYLEGCEMDRCTIVGNASGNMFGSAGLGGGIFAINSTIRSSLIASNGAANGADSSGDGVVLGFGGGVYLRGGSLLDLR